MNKPIKAEDERKEKPFPKLMKTAVGKYVWFVESGKGVVVFCAKHPLEYYNGNIEGWDMGRFEDTDDKIILNEKD